MNGKGNIYIYSIFRTLYTFQCVFYVALFMIVLVYAINVLDSKIVPPFRLYRFEKITIFVTLSLLFVIY